MPSRSHDRSKKEFPPLFIHIILRWCSWAPAILLPIAVVYFTPGHWPRWLFMWLLALALFAGLKWLTWRRSSVSGVSLRRQAGYLLLWPGLDATTFFRARENPSLYHPKTADWLRAGIAMGCGIALLWGGRILAGTDNDYLLGWFGMIGIILILHFGLFHLLSCVWCSFGIRARPLMNHPLVSVRLSEFWGKRWNTAFSGFTQRFIFRPLIPLLGSKGALFAGFVISGLIHDLVISVPAGGGYGGPTLFFTLQPVAILLQRTAVARALRFDRGPGGWLFTLVALGVPLYVLFHPPFIRNIIIPLMQALGAA